MFSVKIAIPRPDSLDEHYCQTILEKFSTSLAGEKAELVVVPLGSTTAALSIVTQCHAVLLPGCPADINPTKYNAVPSPGLGPIDAARDHTDEVLLEHAFAGLMPILGVCHGLQALNVFLGGGLVQQISTKVIDHARSEDERIAHRVVVEAQSEIGKSLLWNGAGVTEISVNSNHHQAVGRLGKGLRICGRSSDGIVEAVEAVDDRHAVLGVQWHPEGLSAKDNAKRGMFSEFVAAARRWKEAGKNSATYGSVGRD